MSIEKKSLISTLKTTKKANVASSSPESTKFAAKKSVKAAPKLMKAAPKLKTAAPKLMKAAPKVSRA